MTGPGTSRGLVAAIVLVALGTAVRLGLVLLGWPETNSDEGTMGLMALHIAQGRDWPAFFYGQGYMGSAEAWAAAGLFAPFGPSLDALRLALVLGYAGFLVVVWRLGELLYDRGVALVSVLFLTLGSLELLEGQLRATGSRVDLLLTGSLIAWLSAWLVLRGHEAGPRRRAAAAAGLGLAAGFGLWTDLLIIPWVLGAGVFLALCWRPAQPRPAFGLLSAGLLLGALPQILHNLHAQWGRDDAITVLLDQRGYQAGAAAPPLLDRVAGAVTISLPYATDGGALTRPETAGAWLASAGAVRVAMAAWGIGVLALLAAAVFRGLIDLRRARAGGRRALPAAPMARLGVLGGAALTVAAFATSPVAVYTPLASSRYLLGVLIAVPVVVGALAWRPGAVSPGRRVLAGVAVTAVVGLLAVDTAGVYQRALALRRTDAEQAALVAALLDHGHTRIWTDYWTCDRIVFESHERIVCGSLDERLGLTNNRYGPYLEAVQADPSAPYVFPTRSAQAAAMQQRGRQSSPLPDGYVIFD